MIFASVACAAGLVAQDAPLAAGVQDGANNVAIADQGGAPDPAPRPRFNDPPPPPPGAQMAPNDGNIPATLTLASGAFMTVRVNQWLSSDRNKPGDTFYATLVQPIIVDGVVVARKGSSVMGTVTEVRKSHSDASSLLGLELTSISLVDGQQITIQSQVMDRNGSTVPGGRQAGAIVGGTAVGAGIGAVAGGGVGAAVGAGVGAMASSIGVMLTRGRPTEVYPETMLTFRLGAPVSIQTAQAAGAFRYASQEDYATGPQTRMAQGAGRPIGPVGAGYGVYPYPYYSPYYSPYYYGPGIGIYVGPRFYGGYRGFHRF